MSTPAWDESQLRNLVHQSERAWANGQPAEAERLLGAARSLSPDHALVLNAAGVQEMQRGNVDSALELIRNAIAKDPRNPAFFINLASLFRRGNRPEDEMKALENALALEPRHLLALLQKASLLDLLGKPRAAASVYHNALQTIPAGTALPESLRVPLQRAVKAVDDNNSALDAFLQQRLSAIESRHPDADLERFRHCLDSLLGKRRIYHPEPTFLHFPHLPALEFYPRAQFDWLDEIEAATAEIRQEFERVCVDDQARLEPYIAYPQGVPLDQWKELNHSRRWSVFYLWRDGRPIEEHLARCPRTAELVAKAPRVDIEGVGPTVFFSILDAKAHIPPHSGVTNTRLIVHVPLVVPPQCRFRVGSQTRPWEPGRAFVFDDTIEHEAWNDSDVPRAVLIFDVWNPYLSPAERDLVRAAVTTMSEYYGRRTPVADSH